MSVWKDREGRYHVAIQRGRKRVHRICPPNATWRDAKRKEAELLGDFDAAAKGKVLIQDAIAKWLTTEVVHQRAKKSTEGNARQLVEWIRGRSLTEVVTIANEYREAHQGLLTNSTINRRLHVLRRVARLAYRRWGWLQEPIWQKIEMLPENDPRIVFLSRSEVAKMLWNIKQRNRRRAALMAAFTGIRRGLIAKYSPIQLQGDLIYLPTTKNRSPLMVPAVHHIRFALKRPFNVHPDTLTHDVSKAAPGKRFHDLRRTAGSWLLQAGVDIAVVSRILGHKDIRTTMRIYAHLLVDNLRAGISRLGGSAQRVHREAVDKGNEKAA